MRTSNAKSINITTTSLFLCATLEREVLPADRSGQPANEERLTRSVVVRSRSQGVRLLNDAISHCLDSFYSLNGDYIYLITLIQFIFKQQSLFFLDPNFIYIDKN